LNSHETERREVEVENLTRFHEYFICSTCGKAFRDAVKVRDLSTTFGKIYYACPRCLNEVNVQDSPPKSPEPAAPATPAPSKPSLECPHYENLKKRLIPDECLVCPKLIECTRKN
jgi:hypothetical protein